MPWLLVVWRVGVGGPPLAGLLVYLWGGPLAGWQVRRVPVAAAAAAAVVAVQFVVWSPHIRLHVGVRSWHCRIGELAVAVLLTLVRMAIL